MEVYVGRRVALNQGRIVNREFPLKSMSLLLGLIGLVCPDIEHVLPLHPTAFVTKGVENKHQMTSRVERNDGPMSSRKSIDCVTS